MEGVKTFFRVLVLIVIFTIFSSASTTINDISNQIAVHLRNWPNEDSISRGGSRNFRMVGLYD